MAASPFNEELPMQFIVTQRKISLPSRIGTSATGIPIGFTIAAESLETTEFIGEPILIRLGTE